MLFLGIGYSWQWGLLFALLFVMSGCIKRKNIHPGWAFALHGLWGLICICFCCCVPTWLVSTGSFLDIGWFRVAMNILCVAAVFGVCLAITGKIAPAVVFASFVLMVMATVNAFVFQFRGNLLKPADLFFVKTAINVAGQYAFEVSQTMATCWF